jgi:hypothetical protein
VIGSSATLSTLLLGLAAFARSAAGFQPGRASSVLIAAAVIVFAIAATFALRSLAPRGYAGATVGSLADAPEKYWDDNAIEATRMVARTQLTTLQKAKDSNDWKALRLEDAIGFEVGAAVVLACGVVLLLLGF